MDIFSLVSKILNECQTPDSKVSVNLYGNADKKSFTESDADPRELAMGIKVEMEHTTDPLVAKKISIDHLSELPNYYTLLKDMEEKGKKQLGERK